MTGTARGGRKATAARALGAGAALFGLAGVLAPRALGAAYAVPDTPDTTSLIRLFGTRTLALAVWTFPARTPEEVDRLLAVGAGMNAVDAVLDLIASGGTDRAGARRSAATSGAFAVLALAIRSMKG